MMYKCVKCKDEFCSDESEGETCRCGEITIGKISGSLLYWDERTETWKYVRRAGQP